VATPTEIDIDEQVMAEAMAASGLATQQATVEAALRLLARQKDQAGMRELFGPAEWQGDPAPDARETGRP
jgi:Arc/MetJ family transcription regulator